MREGAPHCPRCGPGSLALFGSEVSALDPRPTSDSRALDRLALALGRQFRVVRLIGRGGFAEVFEVVDTDLQRRLAVKVLRSDLPWSAATIRAPPVIGSPPGSLRAKLFTSLIGGGWAITVENPVMLRSRVTARTGSPSGWRIST